MNFYKFILSLLSLTFLWIWRI